MRRTVLNTPVDATTIADAVATVENWVDDDRRAVALYVNAYVMNLIRDDPGLGRVFACGDLVYADGMSVVWAARLLGHEVPERIPLTHVIDDFAASWAARGFSVFLFGGEPGRADSAAEQLRTRFPGLRIAGTRSGFFTLDESQAVVDDINASGADILLVGLGTPRQELWVSENIHALQVSATMTCGGLFDWLSGKFRPAPRWIGSLGAEWVYRLILQPRRMFPRYVIGNPQFAWGVLRAFLARRGLVPHPVEASTSSATLEGTVAGQPLDGPQTKIVIDLRDGVPADQRWRVEVVGDDAVETVESIDLTATEHLVSSTVTDGSTEGSRGALRSDEAAT